MATFQSFKGRRERLQTLIESDLEQACLAYFLILNSKWLVLSLTGSNNVKHNSSLPASLDEEYTGYRKYRIFRVHALMLTQSNLVYQKRP